jgi:diaminopimelate epimerase
LVTSYWRYSATGNTFLIFNNLAGNLDNISCERLAKIAKEYEVDGLLFLEAAKTELSDFHMRYVNADGGEVEMCGNGARSIVHFAGEVVGLRPKNKNSFLFSTLNSLYEGKSREGYPIKMTEVKDWQKIKVDDLVNCQFSYYLNTGVPHAIFQVEDLKNFDVISHGKRVRYDERFENGVNANFFEVIKTGIINMRTYERGVEGETESCGTGATATALAIAKTFSWPSPIVVHVLGGELSISFKNDFSEVYLEGPVDLVEENTLKL